MGSELDGLRVRFLGSGDAFGSGGRLQTCILVESAERSLLLDCGATALPALKAAGVEPHRIGAVLITHLHGDHFGGVPFLVLDAQLSRREAPLVVAGPPGTSARVLQAMDVLFPGSAGARRRFELELRELPAGIASLVAGVRVTPFEVVHPSGAPSFALRVEVSGRVITYSGDTEWTESLIAASSGADLFVCEAYTYDRKVRFHLDYATLLRQRERLDCRRIVITHMSPDLLARTSELELEAAHDGLIIEL